MARQEFVGKPLRAMAAIVVILTRHFFCEKLPAMLHRRLPWGDSITLDHSQAGRRSKLPISPAGSDGRCNTLLIGWFNDTSHRGPISQAALIRSKQGAVFFETAFADEFSL